MVDTRKRARKRTGRRIDCSIVLMDTVGAQAYIRERVKVNEETGCWEWQGRVDAQKYGRARWAGKGIKAHRFAYLAFKGPIPEGLHACHSCDNRKCANPEHLWLGTNLDNMRDADVKGRINTPERRKATSERLKAQWADLEYRARMVGLGKMLWADPEYKARMVTPVETKRAGYVPLTREEKLARRRARRRAKNASSISRNY